MLLRSIFLLLLLLISLGVFQGGFGGDALIGLEFDGLSVGCFFNSFYL